MVPSYSSIKTKYRTVSDALATLPVYVKRSLRFLVWAHKSFIKWHKNALGMREGEKEKESTFYYWMRVIHLILVFFFRLPFLFVEGGWIPVICRYVQTSWILFFFFKSEKLLFLLPFLCVFFFRNNFFSLSLSSAWLFNVPAFLRILFFFFLLHDRFILFCLIFGNCMAYTRV